MRPGTHAFSGDEGKHKDGEGNECLGRAFQAEVLGVGGVHANVVRCLTCSCELAASENTIIGPAPYPRSA